jgi:6,7-dimethyl-8-ribityllumazine synthase
MRDRVEDIDASGLRIGVACSRYHRAVTEALQAGAVEAFVRAGGVPDDLHVVEAPGTFELTGICQALARRDELHGVVALGCVIRGETTHDQHLGEAVAHGLTRIALDTGKPVAFGVLTCQTMHQARERAGGEQGNKGAEAMIATIAAVRSMRAITGTEVEPA